MREWEDFKPRFRPSVLCLKQHGPTKAIVVKIATDAILSSSKARMYEVWVGERKTYDPTDEYKVGQVLRL